MEKLLPLTKKGIIVALDNPIIDESGYENYVKVLEKSVHSKRLQYFFMPNDKYKDLNDVKINKTWITK